MVFIIDNYVIIIIFQIEISSSDVIIDIFDVAPSSVVVSRHHRQQHDVRLLRCFTRHEVWISVRVFIAIIPAVIVAHFLLSSARRGVITPATAAT